VGAIAADFRRKSRPKLRATRLSEAEKEHLRRVVSYEGRAYHKRNPGDFNLTPPAAPLPDKTLCDEAGITRRADALELLELAIEGGLVSEHEAPGGLPKRLWVVDAGGRVFEAMWGGLAPGSYHGYPVRRSEPMHDDVLAAWRKAP
jgi:hypothetical protein